MIIYAYEHESSSIVSGKFILHTHVFGGYADKRNFDAKGAMQTRDVVLQNKRIGQRTRVCTSYAFSLF